jgi:hypothetical protein
MPRAYYSLRFPLESFLGKLHAPLFIARDSSRRPCHNISRDLIWDTRPLVRHAAGAVQPRGKGPNHNCPGEGTHRTWSWITYDYCMCRDVNLWTG